MDRELHQAHAELDESHWWFLARRRIIDATLHLHVRRRGGEVLDIGSGAGGLLDVLAGFGQVAAVEGDQAAATIASARHPRCTVVHGGIDEGLEACPRPTLVTVFDVIEHIEDDVGALRRLRSAMAVNGTLCVTVPALPWLWSEHDVLNHHHRRYTARSLRTVLGASGFQVRHLSYFNTILLPGIALARLLQRLGGPGAGADFGVTLGVADRLLEAVFSSERFVVPRIRIPIGVSLIAVGST